MVFKGRVKVGFEEVFNFELNVWINCGIKLMFFEPGVRSGSDNIILKLGL